MIPEAVISIRREICARCDDPCATYQASQLDHTAPAASCPRAWSGRWGYYGTPGLGTRLQQGIHAALDVLPMPAATRTAIKGCVSCGKRVDALDRAFPGTPPGPAP